MACASSRQLVPPLKFRGMPVGDLWKQKNIYCAKKSGIAKKNSWACWRAFGVNFWPWKLCRITQKCAGFAVQKNSPLHPKFQLPQSRNAKYMPLHSYFLMQKMKHIMPSETETKCFSLGVFQKKSKLCRSPASFLGHTSHAHARTHTYAYMARTRKCSVSTLYYEKSELRLIGIVGFLL